MNLPLPERPRLRDELALRPVVVDGQEVIVLRDPTRFSEAVLGLSPQAVAIARFFDGERTLREIQNEISRVSGGVIVPLEKLEELVGVLDQSLFLVSPRLRESAEAWKNAAVRPPPCAGGSYLGEAVALKAFLDAQYTREKGPGGPPRPSGAAPVRAVLSPHIDFNRGGHAYAWAWRAVEEACEAELFVVFGTAHYGTGRSRFALTRKSYDTPLGLIETDAELVEKVTRAYEGPDDLFEAELAHRGEHSIEFQMVELAHLYHGKRKVRALPVLCGSIHDLIDGKARPSDDARSRAFQDALARALADVAPEKICFVAGIDLAHTGVEFDDDPLDEATLARVLEDDRKMLTVTLGSQDPDAVHDDLRRDHELRKICGHAPLVATLEAARRQRDRWGKLAGELLCHDRWYDGESTVSFASAVLRPEGRR